MGSVGQSAFKVEVPFEMRYGLIILKVMIHGKEHKFILDTGAPNVISKELAKELGVKVAGKGKAVDSRGNSDHLAFTAIDSIGIGGLQFLNTGAAIGDMMKSAEISCFNVDGLIGANLMRKAIWQFDYQKHIITITSNREWLETPANAQVIKFHTTATGTPLINFEMNGQEEHNMIIDLGSNSDFHSSAKEFEILKKHGLTTNTYTYGLGTSGIFGRGEEDTTWYAVISSLGSDSLKLSNQVVDFSKNGAKTIGTKFLKNYRLIFDWSSNELIMIPVSSYDNIKEKMFKFTFTLKDHMVFIGSRNSVKGARVEGPQVGDQVLEVNGQDVRNCSQDTWCTLLNMRFDDSITTNYLLVKRGDKELHFNVAKETLFP